MHRQSLYFGLYMIRHLKFSENHAQMALMRFLTSERLFCPSLNGLEWNGTGLEWTGLEWTGLEWNGSDAVN